MGGLGLVDTRDIAELPPPQPSPCDARSYGGNFNSNKLLFVNSFTQCLQFIFLERINKVKFLS